jgi:CHAT domain-containing protein
MATGARTVLLSRWRNGGQTSYDLMREFVQELPYNSASDAWQRSVQLAMDDEIVLEREPRVKDADLEVGISSGHPFFWAGFLLVDTGSEPK